MKLEEMKMKELFDMSHTIAERIFDNHAYPWEVLPEIGDWDPFFLKMSIGRSVKISGSIKLQRLRLRL